MPAIDITITDNTSDVLTPVVEIQSVNYLDGSDNYITGNASDLGLTAAFVSGDLGRISWGTTLQSFLKAHYLSAGQSELIVTYTVSTPATSLYDASSVTDVFTIAAENSVITWDQCTALNTLELGGTVVLSASATGGQVIYTSADSNVVATVGTGLSTLSAVGGGTTTLSASQSGSDCHLPAQTLTCSITIPDISLYILDSGIEKSSVTHSHSYQYTYFDTSSASSQTVTLTGNSITGAVTGTSNAGDATNFQYSTGGTWTDCSTNFIIPNSMINNQSLDLYFRLKHDLAPRSETSETFTFTNAGVDESPVVILRGTVTAPIGPTFYITPDSITGLGYEQGSYPGLTKSFYLKGTGIPPAEVFNVTKDSPFAALDSANNTAFNATGNLISSLSGYTPTTGALNHQVNVSLNNIGHIGRPHTGSATFSIDINKIGSSPKIPLYDTISFEGTVTKPSVPVTICINPGVVDDIDIGSGGEDHDIYLVIDKSGSMGAPRNRYLLVRTFLTNLIRGLQRAADDDNKPVTDTTYRFHVVGFSSQAGWYTTGWQSLNMSVSLIDSINKASQPHGGTNYTAAFRLIQTQLSLEITKANPYRPRESAKKAILFISDGLSMSGGGSDVYNPIIRDLQSTYDCTVYPILLGKTLNPYTNNATTSVCEFTNTAGTVYLAERDTDKDGHDDNFSAEMLEVGRIGQQLLTGQKNLIRFVYTDFNNDNCSMSMNEALQQLRMYLSPQQGTFSYNIKNLSKYAIDIPFVNSSGTLDTDILTYKTFKDSGVNLTSTAEDPILTEEIALWRTSDQTIINLPPYTESKLIFGVTAKCPITTSHVKTNLKIETTFDLSQFKINNNQDVIDVSVVTGPSCNQAVSITDNKASIKGNLINIIGDDSGRDCGQTEEPIPPVVPQPNPPANTPIRTLKYTTGVINGGSQEYYFSEKYQKLAPGYIARAQGYNEQNKCAPGTAGMQTIFPEVIDTRCSALKYDPGGPPGCWWENTHGAIFTHGLGTQSIDRGDVILTGYDTNNNPVNIEILGVSPPSAELFPGADPDNQIRVHYILPPRPANANKNDWPAGTFQMEKLSDQAKATFMYKWKLDIYQDV
jgi:hypothetical protein